MVKLISQLTGARVLLFQERAFIGEVQRVLISPDDGSLVGFVITPTHQKELAYIPTNEIKGYGQGFLLIENLTSLSETDEVIKIRQVLDNEPKIIGTTVVTESGLKLGKVSDATVDVRLNTLKKLYVSGPISLGPFGTQKVIDLKQIVKIERKTIIVRDSTQKERQSLMTPAEATTGE